MIGKTHSLCSRGQPTSGEAAPPRWGRLWDAVPCTRAERDVRGDRVANGGVAGRRCDRV